MACRFEQTTHVVLGVQVENRPAGVGRPDPARWHLGRWVECPQVPGEPAIPNRSAIEMARTPRGGCWTQAMARSTVSVEAPASSR